MPNIIPRRTSEAGQPTAEHRSLKTSAVASVWDWEPEPDVVWGSGGIDDWGWTAHEPRSSTNVPSRPQATLQRRLIPMPNIVRRNPTPVSRPDPPLYVQTADAQ